jgi:hypothetical protein
MGGSPAGQIWAPENRGIKIPSYTELPLSTLSLPHGFPESGLSGISKPHPFRKYRRLICSAAFLKYRVRICRGNIGITVIHRHLQPETELRNAGGNFD